jgi:hypothetical protein
MAHLVLKCNKEDYLSLTTISDSVAETSLEYKSHSNYRYLGLATWHRQQAQASSPNDTTVL